MKNIWIIAACLFLGSCCRESNPHPAGITHVVVIGLDGMSTQGLIEAETPCMDSLMQNGAYSYTVRCVLPTVSKPNWNAMLCGAGPDITGVVSNGWYRDQEVFPPVVMTENHSFPNIFRIVREQMPNAELGSLYHWGDFGSMLDKDDMNLMETYPSSLETAEKTAAYILEKLPAFVFIQLDAVDGYGHNDGHMSPGYLNGIKEADDHVRIIVDAIKNAGIQDSTLIMIVSDHGGIFHGHGGNTYEELTTPIIFAGKGIKKNYAIRQQIYRYDVAADVAFALGLQAPQQWTGRPTLPAYEGFEEPANLWQGVEILPPPVFHTETYNPPHGGSFDTQAEVKIKIPAGVKGEIRYTIDESVPTRESALYETVFTVEKSTVIRAKIFGEKAESPVVTAEYTVGNNKTK
ncbi:MAG: alkaline phosphatase family protein [Tannerellaceae bacterium]|jgi:hypothetical protein|nr:alkaline phosphatase family protein [Tannerellaceae bacterium]